tara:strand:- start:662486 stop:662992 length:507 start_codon:yes stop_codon:yes gene_type:complete
MSNEFDTLRPHATKIVSVGDQQAEIDVELAPLIEQMWRVGISTMMCCQETDPGIAWIEFDSVEDLMKFLNLVVPYDPNPESLYSRVNWQRTAVDPADCWEFQFNLLDILKDQQEQTEDGFSHFMPTVGAYFPRSDIRGIYERLETYSNYESLTGRAVKEQDVLTGDGE